MTFFLKSGNTFRPSAEAALDLHYTLPVGTYTVKKDMFGNFFLEAIDNFTFPGKRYGDNIKHTDRIFSTFKAREVSTGALFSGEKGSGKSLLAKSLAIKGYENGIPTIVVNEPWCGEDFNQFVQMIEQECIIIFDEFEKVYDSDQQAAVLTLLDGVYPTKKLFILTCNDKYRIDSHMKNRPGRIYYMIEFKGLSAEFIEEYCNDNLENKSHIQTLVKLSALFYEFNFDMLKAMVEEMNRYDETPQQALELLNAKPELDSRVEYKIDLIVDGLEIKPENLDPTVWHGVPMAHRIAIEYQPNNDGNNEWERTQFTPNDLNELNPFEDKFVFITEHTKLTLTKLKDKKFDYWSAF